MRLLLRRGADFAELFSEPLNLPALLFGALPGGGLDDAPVLPVLDKGV